MTVGTSADTYAYDGRSGDIDLMLWPVNFTLAYVGYEVVKPFVAFGVEAGIRYSDSLVIEQRLKSIEDNLAARLTNLDDVASVPFNRMSDWGENGRVKSCAPAFSPFIRHREQLTLEDEVAR